MSVIAILPVAAPLAPLPDIAPVQGAAPEPPPENFDDYLREPPPPAPPKALPQKAEHRADRARGDGEAPGDKPLAEEKDETPAAETAEESRASDGAAPAAEGDAVAARWVVAGFVPPALAVETAAAAPAAADEIDAFAAPEAVLRPAPLVAAPEGPLLAAPVTEALADESAPMGAVAPPPPLAEEAALAPSISDAPQPSSAEEARLSEAVLTAAQGPKPETAAPLAPIAAKAARADLAVAEKELSTKAKGKGAEAPATPQSRSEVATPALAPAGPALASAEPPTVQVFIGLEAAEALAGPAPLQGPGSAAAQAPGAAAPRAAPLLARAETLAPTLAQAARDLAPGPGEIVVHLRPEELGQVQMKLAPEGEGLRIYLMADRPETQELLRRHLGQFQAELKAAGFDAASFSFAGGAMGQSGGETPPQTQSFAAAGPDSAAPRAELAPLALALAQAQGGLLPPGGLDLRL